jgi:hypothetical protein
MDTEVRLRTEVRLWTELGQKWQYELAGLINWHLRHLNAFLKNWYKNATTTKTASAFLLSPVYSHARC